MSNKVTYIIVTWNNENEISDCLESIIKYTTVGYEIIVLDNNSTDSTVELIHQRFPTVKLLNKGKNYGFAEGNNLALQEVITDFVCFINPDTILLEDIVTPSISLLNMNDKVGLVGSKLVNYDMSDQASCFNFAGEWSLPFEILHMGKLMPKKLKKKYFVNYSKLKNVTSVPWIIGAEMIMRTSDARYIGGFSTEYFMYTEDMDLCMKVHSILKKDVVYLPEQKLIHLGGASEKQNVNYNKQKKLFENDILFVSKFYGKDAANRMLKNMKIAYKIRLAIIVILYHKKNRQMVLDKTKSSLNILEELN